MTSGSFLFFAFGALLENRKMIELDARCEQMGLAVAEGQRLTFTEAGVANLKPDPESSICGMLWLVPAEKMGELDQWARARGMKRGVVSVVSPAGPKVPATSYFDRTAADGVPADHELNTLIVAAVRFGMNRDYQADLAKRFGNL
jgi:hypothetical protein